MQISKRECKSVKENANKDVEDYEELILKDVLLKSEKFDEIIGEIGADSEHKLNLKFSDNDVYDVFNQIVKSNLSGFAPKRSIPNMRGAIYQWFRNYLGINYQVDGGAIRIQRIVLHPHNVGKFSNLLSKTTETYRPIKKKEVKEKIRGENYDWEVKKEEFYNQFSDEKVDYKLCIYEPCYLNVERSTPEKNFEKYLETKTETIEWWYKNGIGKKDFFGIQYEDNELPETFYPDYIIQFKSGKIGIFDTKKGQTAKESALKAEALQKYIKSENAKGKNLIGGIVIQNKSDKWIFNQNDDYTYDMNDLTSWNYFDDID